MSFVMTWPLTASTLPCQSAIAVAAAMPCTEMFLVPALVVMPMLQVEALPTL
jgi:hypothetical protein